MSKKRSRWGIEIPDNAIDPLGDTAHTYTEPEQREPVRGKFSGINKARARSTPGALNKVEKEREQDLETLRCAGEIQGYLSQAIVFQLGHRLSYRPDFAVIELDGLVVCEEIKGERGWKLDPKGRVKWKVAAEKFPLFAFRGLLRKPGGGFKTETYEPRSAWPPVRPTGGDE